MRGGLRARFIGVLDAIGRGATVSCQLAIALMTALVALQVVLRYIFRAPLPWVEEASIFLMIWMAFIGAGVALRSGSHIALTMLRDRMPRRISSVFSTLSYLLVLAFLLLVMWEGANLVPLAQGQRSAALGIPMALPYLTLPLGAAFMITQVIAAMLEISPSARAATNPEL